MNDPRVSVIMPAYNAGTYITEAITSVLQQTFLDWELIVVDDGSTDNTAQIVKQFATNDNRVKYLYQQNGKQGKARNKGIAEAKGHYLAFLDADDMWLSAKLEEQLAAFSASPNTDLLFCAGYTLKNGIKADFDIDIQQRWDAHDLPAFIERNRIPILSVMVKKETVTAAGCFSEDPKIQNAEDYHLWLRLLLSGCVFRSLPGRLFIYRMHAQQVTSSQSVATGSVFYAYADIFYKYEVVRSVLIKQLRWYLFNTAYHAAVVKIIADHFALKGSGIMAFWVKNLLGLNVKPAKKILFAVSK